MVRASQTDGDTRAYSGADRALEAEQSANGGGIEDTVLLVPVALRAGEDQVAGVVGAEALGWGLEELALWTPAGSDVAEMLVQNACGQRDHMVDLEARRHIALRVDAELAHLAVLGEVLAQDVAADLGERGPLDCGRIEVEQFGVVVERLTLPAEELGEEPAVGFELERNHRTTLQSGQDWRKIRVAALKVWRTERRRSEVQRKQTRGTLLQ